MASSQLWLFIALVAVSNCFEIGFGVTSGKEKTRLAAVHNVTLHFDFNSYTFRNALPFASMGGEGPAKLF